MTVGVKVSTSTVPGPGTTDTAPGSAYFVVGQTLRGNPTQPVVVGSPAQFAATFGPAVSYGFLTNDLNTFFGEGGTHAFVARAVGPAAAAGTLSLLDQTTPTGVATLKLEAGAPTVDPASGKRLLNAPDPGSWSSGLSVQVAASALTNQWKLIVFYQGVQVEEWGPFPDVASAVSKINSASGYLFATNLFSTSTGTTANPAVLAATSLSAGTDDRTNITTAIMTAQLALFVPALGSGYVAIPGYDASLVGAALIAHGATNGRDVHLSPTQGVSNTAVAGDAAAFRGTTGSQDAGYFWPWVTVPDGQGGSLVVPPDGYVAGLRSRTVAAIGPWQPPAGNWGVARYVTGLDPASGVVTDAIGDALNDEHVNVIRPKAGIRLYGWRSLSTDTVNFELLSMQDTLNLLDFQLSTQLQQYAFATIDGLGQLFSKMRNTARSVLQPLIAAGALYPGPADSNGNPTDPGYTIDTGPDVNTPTTLAANEAAIAVYVRLSPTAELIQVSLVKVAVGNAF